MVTWSFDLLALFIGFAVGLLLGGLLFAFMETKDGGAWACQKCMNSLHQPYIWNPYERNFRYCPWCGRRMK